MNVAITPPLQRLINRVYPGMSPRQQAGQIRELLYDILLDQIPAPDKPEPELPFSFMIPEPEEAPKDIANRVSDNAPAIDDQNWSAIKRGITKAQELGLWDHTENELRLTSRLNDPFDGAINEHRVQKSRITAFFDRLL